MDDWHTPNRTNQLCIYFLPLQTLILFQPLHVVRLLISTTRDGHKDKCSDLNVIDEKPISVLETSAIDGKGREKLTFDIPNAKSEQSELKKPKTKKKSLLSRIEAKPSQAIHLIHQIDKRRSSKDFLPKSWNKGTWRRFLKEVFKFKTRMMVQQKVQCN